MKPIEPRALCLAACAFALISAFAACASSSAETIAAPAESATTLVVAPAVSQSVLPASAAECAPTPAGSAPVEMVITPDAGSDAASADAGEDGGAAAPECPPEMVKIARYCVDRYEAHLVSAAEDGAVTQLAYYQHPDTSRRFEARSEADVYPQGYISRDESTLACKNVGKRLCSRAEWSRACKGSKGFHFPYGARMKANACNSGKGHLLTRFFGSDASHWKYDESFNNPKLNQEPGFLAKTGEFASCEAAGVFDMVGNLHEWVKDIVDDDIEELLERDQVSRRKQPHRRGNGIFMGGFFSTTDELGPGCTYATIAHEPAYHDYSTGFRCCKDLPAPPSTKKKSQH
ncbi:MAG: SUMF1/EgtB/PvdO family nonheme iron enzyme [Minicystis sp.]